MEYLTLLFYLFATFRIIVLFSKDNGPWDVFDLIRYKFGVRTRLDHDGNPELFSEKFFGRVIICASSCFSFYVLVTMSVLFYLNIFIVNYIIYFLGCWGFVLLLVLTYEKLSEKR